MTRNTGAGEDDELGIEEMATEFSGGGGLGVGDTALGGDGVGKDGAEVPKPDEVGNDEDAGPDEGGSERAAKGAIDEQEGDQEPHGLPAGKRKAGLRR